MKKSLNSDKYKFNDLWIQIRALYADHKFNMHCIKESINILNTIIKDCKKLKDNDSLVLCTSRLAYVYYCQGKAKKGLNILESINPKDLLKAKRYHIYKYYFRYGICYQVNREYPKSRKQFKTSLEYATNEIDIIESEINIALTFKLQGTYNIAIRYNKQILKDYNNKEYQCVILNNLSNLYYSMNNIEKAKEAIEEAIDIMPDRMKYNRKVNIYDTYLMVKSNDELNGTLDYVIDILKDSNKSYDNRQFILRCIDRVIEACINKDDFVCSKKLAYTLQELIEKENDVDELQLLKNKFADIMLYLNKKGEIICEEATGKSYNSNNGNRNDWDGDLCRG